MKEFIVMDKRYIVEEVEMLYNHINFREFEKDMDNHCNIIFYADGEIESVLEAIEDEWEVAKSLVSRIVLFDGWYIALAELY